jgi:ElaB/YqjD/DUF883 family membrane-anchored ribosome-binding protein
MNAIISRLLREATAPIVESSTRLVQKAVLVLFAVISLFVSWVFITVAFYAFLEPLIGHADTALSVAGLYLFASLLFLYSAKRQWPGRTHRPRAAESAKLMQDTAESNQEKADFVNNIDKSVAPFLDILQEAGMERERLALQAGAEVARQLTPFSLVAFAMAVGIIIGRLIGREKPVSP